jgi:sortase family protein
MSRLLDDLRTRVLPAILTAFGVTILSAGLLTYSVPVDAGAASPSAPPSAAIVATPTPLIPLPSIGTASLEPTPSPTPPPDRVATRVRISGLGIDLPVVKGNNGYPLCNVAMYLVAPGLYQPGFGRATYIYAHAREGMFLPLLRTLSRDQRGLEVEVWTSDDVHFTYQISEVRRAQTSLKAPMAATTEQLWLQTSEGPKGTVGKTQVVATFVSSEPASDVASHPRARPVVCG